MRLQAKREEGMSVSLQKFKARHSYNNESDLLPELNIKTLLNQSRRSSPKKTNQSILKFYLNDMLNPSQDTYYKRRVQNSEYLVLDSYLENVSQNTEERKGNSSLLTTDQHVDYSTISQLPNLPACQMRERMRLYANTSQKEAVQQFLSQCAQRRPPKTACILSQKSISVSHTPPSLKYRISAKKYCVYIKYPNKPSFTRHFSLNDESKCEVASITKIMTCYTALKFFDQNQLNPQILKVKIPSHAESIDGTSAFLNAGGILNAIQLMYALMLPSGNDAALVLSTLVAVLMQTKNSNYLQYQNYIQGTPIDCEYYLDINRKQLKLIFIQSMNENAQRLRMTSTNYSSVHGLNDQNNQTTAANINLLIQECIKIPLFMDIVTTKSYKTHAIQDNGDRSTAYKWKNTNKLLKKGWQGIKTGVTTNAGPCFSGYYKNDQLEAIIIVLNCSSMDQRWRDAENLVKSLLPK